MKFIFLKFIFIIFLFQGLTLKPGHANSYKVVIDPGHGGIDSGAVRDIFKESDITLQVAEKISLILSDPIKHNFSSDVHVEVYLTRTTNKTLSLEERVKFAENKKADLFISLHANASKDRWVKGMEFYFKKGTSSRLIQYKPTKPDLSKSAIDQSMTNQIISELALFGQIRQSLKFNQILEKQILENTRVIIKRAPFYVIERTTMPSALIEIGFISNLSEAKMLVTEERQFEIAESIVKSIYDYFSDNSSEI